MQRQCVAPHSALSGEARTCAPRLQCGARAVVPAYLPACRWIALNRYLDELAKYEAELREWEERQRAKMTAGQRQQQPANTSGGGHADAGGAAAGGSAAAADELRGAVRRADAPEESCDETVGTAASGSDTESSGEDDGRGQQQSQQQGGSGSSADAAEEAMSHDGLSSDAEPEAGVDAASALPKAGSPAGGGGNGSGIGAAAADQRGQTAAGDDQPGACEPCIGDILGVVLKHRLRYHKGTQQLMDELTPDNTWMAVFVSWCVHGWAWCRLPGLPR